MQIVFVFLIYFFILRSFRFALIRNVFRDNTAEGETKA